MRSDSVFRYEGNKAFQQFCGAFHRCSHRFGLPSQFRIRHGSRQGRRGKRFSVRVDELRDNERSSFGHRRRKKSERILAVADFVVCAVRFALSDYTARQLCRQLRDNAAALLRLSGRLGNGRAYERGYIFLHSNDGYSLRVSACRMADAVAQIQGFCANRRILFRFGGVPCRFFRYSRLCLSLNFRFGRVGYWTGLEKVCNMGFTALQISSGLSACI